MLNRKFFAQVASVAVTFIIPVLTHADVSSADPAIGHLRNSFAAGIAPVAADLQVGKRWNCLRIIAIPGDSTSYAGTLNFELNGQLAYIPENMDTRPTANQITAKVFTFTTTQLLSEAPYYFPDAKAWVAIRKAQNGDLVFEFSAQGVSKKGVATLANLRKNKGWEQGIAKPNTVSLVYGRCSLSVD